MPDSIDAIVFYASATVAVVSSILVVTRRNAIYSAVFMVVFFTMIALNFLILRAPFLAIIQLLVYAGAIMVLYLFVIMLLNLKPEEIREEVPRNRKVLAGMVSLALFLLLAFTIRTSEKVNATPPLNRPLPAADPSLDEVGSVHGIAVELFSDHGLAFELTSILILIAIIGAIYLTKKRRAPSHDGTQPG